MAGKADAIAELAETTTRPLYRFCLYRVGGDHHLCEDVVSQTMLQAIDRLERYDPDRCGGDIFKWLTGLARNEIRRALSACSAAGRIEQFWRSMDDQLLSLYAAIESEPLEEDLLARDETRQLVNAAVAQLPLPYGRLLEARYMRGLSVKQVARDMDTTPKAAESMLTRARKAFRETFLALTRNVALPDPAAAPSAR